MCGIAGLLCSNANQHTSAVRNMLSALTHRGPDGSGIWVSPTNDCVLGHRRLAILDRTDAAAQPMADAIGDAISYNGECYNFRTLRGNLQRHGESFTSNGDTEVVLKLLSRQGETALPSLNGMFAIAHWDEQHQRLLLARDRFGQKPLYWAPYANGLVFASEVRALLASGLIERHLDLEGVATFLSQGAVQGPSTIVRNVRLLPRATRLSMGIGREPTIKSYWTPSRDKQDVSSAELRQSFCNAVSRHLVSDAPLGVFLSGGVDSSAIAAAARQFQQITSLAVVFPDHPSHCESSYSSSVANRLGTNHIEVPVTDRDIVDRVERSRECLDQPSIDGVNTFIVSQAARQAGLTVALSGLGGDELFGGYSTFEGASSRQRWASRLRLLAPFASIAERWSWSDHRIAKMLDLFSAKKSLIASYSNSRCVFTSEQARRLLPGFDIAWSDGLPLGRHDELTRLLNARGLPDQIGHLELEVYMGQTLLRDSDVMGMANNLEIRVPFLDTEFSDLVLALPCNARMPQNKQRKWRLIEATKDWLPTESWSRSKQGFALPWASLMTGILKPHISLSIDRLEKSGWFAPLSVRQLWEQFLRNPHRVGWSRIWAMHVLSDYVDRNALTLEGIELESLGRVAA